MLIHRELDMLTLEQRRTLHVAKQMFLIDEGAAPETVLSKFTKLENTTDRRTRLIARGNFKLPNYRLQLTRRSFVYRGIRLWENFPTQLKLFTEVEGFVSGVKQWLKDGDVGIT